MEELGDFDNSHFGLMGVIRIADPANYRGRQWRIEALPQGRQIDSVIFLISENKRFLLTVLL